MINFSFPKGLRLLTPSNFSFVFQKPQRIGTAHVTILSRLNTLDHPRIGIAVAKKYIKYAHERNRIKRLTRESFRLHQHNLVAMDFVMIAKKRMIDLNNRALTELLERLWDRYYH